MRRWALIQTEARDDRAARNEALFRRVNERLEEVNDAFHSVVDDAEFVCECASIDCVERIELTLADYEALRSVPTHFVVKPAHVLPEAERIVEERDGYSSSRRSGMPAIVPGSSTLAATESLSLPARQRPR